MESRSQGGQEVAVNHAKFPTRSRAERLRTRLERLRWISEYPRVGADQVSMATAALAQVHVDGGRELTHIRVRPSLITRRQEPAGEMSDRRPPDGPRPPILEVASPRGIAQQLELVALFVAQVQKARHKDGQVTFGLDLDTTDAAATDWVDLVVPHSDHSLQAVYAASRRDNRLRQIKRALDSLVSNSLAKLPNATATRGKYDGFRLLDEGGARLIGPPLPYRVPEAGEEVIEIPIDFFLQGWVYVLTPSEIAFWLMLRHLRGHVSAGSHEPPLSVDGDTRLRRYDIRKDAYKGWWLHDLAGLLDVDVDSGRRSDGTVANFDPKKPPERHHFFLTDDGLHRPAASAVKVALDVALEGEPVGVARAQQASAMLPFLQRGGHASD